eukprot:TRINITY_DN3253_c0_g1_i3.p3 TRINITY_DN3253_c0_g1~~TRINITY_DN3253_c0_g1_i3.p3  ORF type:complete len:357 (+),score=136.28 TRINITY_DN3253_c0_g1_i3:2275-3345(+)
MLDWINNNAELINSVNLDANPTVVIKEHLMPPLRNASDPSFANVFDAVSGLIDAVYLNLDHPKTIDLLTLAISTYLLSKRLLMQLYALLASWAQDNNDDQEYTGNFEAFQALLVEFSTTLDEWSTKFTDGIARLKADRLACISDVTFYDHRHTECYDAGARSVCKTVGPTGYKFDDSRGQGYSQDNHEWTTGCCNKHHMTSSEPEVRAARDKHVAEVTQQLEAQYQANLQVHGLWMSSLAKVAALMPPKQPLPDNVPTVSGFDASKLPPTAFKDASDVRYRVSYANSCGPSLPSIFSEWVPIESGAPVLTVPVDPLQAATTRIVHRQVRKDGQPQQPTLAFRITDNTTTSFTDHAA